MTSSKQERYYSAVSNSRRGSPAENQNHGFFSTGQGGRTVLPPLSDTFPNSSRFPVPATYSNAYAQPRSAPNKLGYDINTQAFFGQYPSTGSSPQFTPTYPNYEIERYSPQPTYPAYASRSTPPPMHNNPNGSRRLPPLSTSPAPSNDRWSQNPYPQPTPAYQTGSNIRSPAASYPPQYAMYNTGNSANAYSYPMAPDHLSMASHNPLFDDGMGRIDHPRSSSPYNRGSSAHIPSQAPLPQSLTPPPPISPISPEEPTIKKKRKRADAAQLKVLNETYARTAFPSTEERIALAKLLDMSARSVQIWFQNKRQSMRQTNRQSSSNTGNSHHPYSVSAQADPMQEDLVPSSYNASMGDTMYLTSASPDLSRTHPSQSHSSHSRSHPPTHYHHQPTPHRHSRDQEELYKWSRA